jgi:predicted exporter
MRRVAVAGVILVAAFLLGRRVHLDEDVARLLPDTSPDLSRATLVMRRLLERAVVDLEAEASTSPEELGRAADRLTQELEESGAVATVRSRLGEGDALALVDLLRERAARLLDARDLEEVEARLEPAAVKETLHVLARRLQEPDGAYLATRAASDPLGITDLALAPMAALTSGERHLLLFVEPGFPATDTVRTEHYLRTLETAAARLAGVRVRHLGTHRSTHDNARQMRRDVQLTAAVGVILVALLAWLALGRLSVAILALFPAVFGAVTALGIYSLFRDAIAAAVAGFAAVLLGITIDYAVHVTYRLVRGGARPPVRAILMGATTTAVAFLALRASSLPGLREIGTFGAIGIAAAALFAILVLPALIRTRGRGPLLDLTRLVARLRAPAVARRLLLAAVVLTPLLLVGAFRVGFEGDVHRLNSLSPPAAADEASIKETWGEAFRFSSLLVERPDLQAALEANDRLDALLGRLETQREISGYGSLAGLLPSLATQQRRLQDWRAFWSPERIERLRHALREGVRGTPFRPDAFEPFFAWLASDPPPLRREEYEKGPLREFFQDRLLASPNGFLVSTPVFTRDFGEVEALQRELDRELPDTVLVNREALVRRLAHLVSRETLKLGLIAFLGVALIVFAWLGRLELTLVVVVPLLLSCIWTFGGLGWLGLRINLANAVFVAFLFGLAVDYSIFLTHARLERLYGGDDRTGEAHASVLLCALTTCAGFGVLTLAGHPVLRSIGATALLGIACAAAATQIFVPAFMSAALRWHRSRLRGAPWDRRLAGLYRHLGVIVGSYAASKVKRDPLVRALPELLADARDVCVAGAGYGIMTARLALAAPACRVRAIEFDARKLGVARAALAECPNVEWVAGDVREVDLGRPDGALVVDLLHYWPADVQQALLARIVDALPVGGRLLFRDGCADTKAHVLVHAAEACARWTGFTRAGGKFSFRTREGWRSLLTESGLVVEEERSELGLFSNLVLLCRKER